ncbi:MAG: N-acetylglucosamine-6-phosphate deacetylase [Micromonosporaceae bacterium]|nr:N-acetylglucosamine-6-phosphate deacetylase [Micromonosporaceae bacterium]
MRVAGRVVTPAGVLEHGRVETDGERIVAVESTTDHSGHWVVPGFVDIHVHGGGGYTFTTADPEQARGAAAFHLAHGTTTLLASLVSSPYDLMHEATKAYAPLAAEGVLGGIHYEGPYLSQVRCGAQNPAYLRDPSIDELTSLLAVADGALRMVTLAPERLGALSAIELLVRHGVVAAIGHTDASYQQTRAAIEAGASVGTHLFNGMPPPHHRAPGPVYALLGGQSVVCELVADGHHLHDGTLHFAATAAGPHRCALVTDALVAAGLPDGRYDLGGRPVEVRAGQAHLAGTDSIAGSTLTMDAAVRRTVQVGVSLVDAVRMASTTPARAIGRTDIGVLAPGARADLVELDDQLRVVRVMRRGRWL